MTFAEFCRRHGCTDAEARELGMHLAFIRMRATLIAVGLVPGGGEEG